MHRKQLLTLIIALGFNLVTGYKAIAAEAQAEAQVTVVEAVEFGAPLESIRSLTMMAPTNYHELVASNSDLVITKSVENDSILITKVVP